MFIHKHRYVFAGSYTISFVFLSTTGFTFVCRVCQHQQTISKREFWKKPS